MAGILQALEYAFGLWSHTLKIFRRDIIRLGKRHNWQRVRAMKAKPNLVKLLIAQNSFKSVKQLSLKVIFGGSVPEN
ncbi:hypothetical protein JCM31185_16250 [Furfurilactobacillus curtus]|uniref:Transposase n=1 Tax=Furfurilactobacillus curtus TaxID=1746200 RepID=A0ABQ5JUU1_9LACO